MTKSKAQDPREKAFHTALTGGDLVAVAQFLDEGFSANHRSEHTAPPMAIALQRNKVDLARLLVQRGYELNGPLEELSLRTALMQALTRMTQSNAAESPMMEFLLSAGADLNVRDKYGATMAHLVSASRGDRSELLARLCTMGLRLDVVDNFGETPFTQANRYGNLKCAEFLLGTGVDVNQRGRDKMTSLIIAGQKGLLEVCQWLVSKGANLHLKDEFNKTALDWARANNHTKVVDFLEQQMSATGASMPPPLPSPPAQRATQGGAPAAGSKSGGFLRSLKRVFETTRKQDAEIPPPVPATPIAMNAKPQIQESGRFASATCWCNKPMRLPIAGGGVLELEPEECIPYEFSFGVKAAGEEVTYLRSIVRLADLSGAVWEGESIWRPSWFVGQVTNFDRLIPPKPVDAADEEVLRALEEDWFVRGAQDLLDDRFDRELFLAGRHYVVPFKYQAPVIDLAPGSSAEDDDREGGSVVVKVSGLYAHPGNEPEEQIVLPSIVFTVDISERLFVNYLFEEDPGAWGDQEIPEIVTFQRTAHKGRANRFIRFSRGTA